MALDPDDDLRDDSLLTYCCAVSPDALWLLRRLFEQWLADRHVAADDADDLVIIVNELCSTIVVHGGGEEIEVNARLSDGVVRIEVVGRKPWASVDPDEVYVTRSLDADLAVEMSPHRARLTCRRPVHLTQVA